MSLFGPYKDFKDCISKNSDKSNPEGYCTMIHKKITGKYPSQMSKHILENVEIFSIGTHTDFEGKTTAFTPEKLKSIVDAFNSGLVNIPIKLGHTSDEHNTKIAKALNIPIEVLKGEGDNSKGAAKLGEVIKLHSNGKLIADISLASDSIANLVKDNLFDNVSIELLEDYVDADGKKYDLVATGLAFLGVQNPAVKNLAGLQAAKLLSQGSKFNKMYLYNMQVPLPMVDVSVNSHEAFDICLVKMAGETADGDVNKLLSMIGDESYDKLVEMCNKMSNMPGMMAGYIKDTYKNQPKVDKGESTDMSELVNKLGSLFKLEKPTEDAILAEVNKLITSSASNFAEMDKTVTNLKKQVRLFEWRSKVASLTSIPGTPDELAGKLVDIEIKAGIDTAQMMFSTFEAQNKLAVELGTTKAILTPSNPNALLSSKKYAFEDRIDKLAIDKKISKEKALAELALNDPKAFGVYRKEKLADLQLA